MYVFHYFILFHKTKIYFKKSDFRVMLNKYHEILIIDQIKINKNWYPSLGSPFGYFENLYRFETIIENTFNDFLFLLQILQIKKF